MAERAFKALRAGAAGSPNVFSYLNVTIFGEGGMMAALDRYKAHTKGTFKPLWHFALASMIMGYAIEHKHLAHVLHEEAKAYRTLPPIPTEDDV